MASEWESAVRGLAEGISFLRSRERTQGVAGTTLQTAIVEAIYALDASAVDPLANLSEGSPQYEEASGRRRNGRLQKIQRLRNLFFGSEGGQGLLAALRAADDPDYR